MWSFWGARPRSCWPGRPWLAVRLRRTAKATRPADPATVWRPPPRRSTTSRACCHLSVYAYWGYYWRPVYDFAPLLVGQLLFAYAFDMLLSWSRREQLRAGLRSVPDHLQHQPVPVVHGRLVRLPVPAGRRRLCRQGVRPLGARRESVFTSSIRRRSRSRIFSVVLLATGTTHSDLGPGDRHHLQPRAAHLQGAVSRRPRGHVLLLDHAGDRDGRRSRCLAAA